MQNEQKFNQNRKIVYWGTLIFLLITFLLLFFQTAMLKWLFNTQISFTWQNALLLFSHSNWLELLIHKITNGTILVVVVLVLEILLFIGLILFFLIYLWKMKKNGRWALSEIFLFTGYAVLFLSSIFCGGFAISVTIKTMTTLQTNFQKVSPAQLQLLANNLTVFLETFTFSLSTIFKDISTFIQGLQNIIGNVKQVAATPTILQNWLDTLNQWLLYFTFCFAGSIVVILSGLLLRLRAIYPNLLRRKQKLSKQEKILEPTTTDRLIKILEQQQLLLEKLEKAAEQNSSSSEKAADE